MAIVKYLWDFGDGETSTEENPTHNYMEGCWTVSLTCWDEDGTKHYEPKYDYVVVTELDWTEYNPSLPDTCYWSPVKGGQGRGVSEFTGDNWVWPSCFNSVCYGYTKDRQKLLLVIDELTQNVYQLNVTDIWKDREEYEIESELHFPANIAQNGPWTNIKHEETRLQLDPYYKIARDEEYNGQSFDSSGFPEDMGIDISIYLDRIMAPATAKAISVPKDGDIVFHQQVNGREIRRHIAIDRAPWYFSGITGMFVVEDKNSSSGEGEISELAMQENILSSPHYWFSRTYIPMFNLARKALGTGDVTEGDLAEGVDGRSDSAILMPTDSGITDSFVDTVGPDFTLISWISGFPAGEGYLWQTSDIAVTVELSGGMINIRLKNLTVFDTYLMSFEVSDADWHNLIIERNATEGKLVCYYNGEEVVQSSMPLSNDSIHNAGDEFTIYWGFHGISVSENKLIPAMLSAEEALYYYQDCAYRCGDGVMPL